MLFSCVLIVLVGCTFHVRLRDLGSLVCLLVAVLLTFVFWLRRWFCLVFGVCYWLLSFGGLMRWFV